METPRTGWPFRMGGINADQIVFVDQDDPVEVEQCVAAVFSVTQGDLVDEPKLGLPDPTFRDGGVRENTLVSVAQRWEKRAVVTFTRDELVGIAQNLDIQVGS